jgi:hypothetical protein
MTLSVDHRVIPWHTRRSVPADHQAAPARAVAVGVLEHESAYVGTAIV